MRRVPTSTSSTNSSGLRSLISLKSSIPTWSIPQGSSRATRSSMVVMRRGFVPGRNTSIG